MFRDKVVVPTWMSRSSAWHRPRSSITVRATMKRSRGKRCSGTRLITALSASGDTRASGNALAIQIKIMMMLKPDKATYL